MNKYAVAHFSSFSGALKVEIVYAESEYLASLSVLTSKNGDFQNFQKDYPDLDSLQGEYLPNVDEWLEVLRVD